MTIGIPIGTPYGEFFFGSAGSIWRVQNPQSHGSRAERVVKFFTNQITGRFNGAKRAYAETFFSKAERFYWQKIKKYGIILKKPIEKV